MYDVVKRYLWCFRHIARLFQQALNRAVHLCVCGLCTWSARFSFCREPEVNHKAQEGSLTDSAGRELWLCIVPLNDADPLLDTAAEA